MYTHRYKNIKYIYTDTCMYIYICMNVHICMCVYT